MSTLERLYAKIKIDPVSGCWIWQGKCKAGTWPAIAGGTDVVPRNRTVRALWAAYKLLIADPPHYARMVCHCTGGKLCVNPHHRSFETPKIVEARRPTIVWTAGAKPKRSVSPSTTPLIGNSKHTTLTPEVVAWVRASNDSDFVIAKASNIPYTTVARIRRAKTTVW